MDGCRVVYLTEGGALYVSAIDVKGVVNVILRNGPGDKSKKYYINGFTISHYSALLEERQPLFPKWCRKSIFCEDS